MFGMVMAWLTLLVAALGGENKCNICNRDRGHWRKYCDRCRKFVYRAGKKSAHVAALKRDYDPVKDCFRCHYTHIILEEKDTKSPKYLTFDHMVPGNEDIDNLVLTFAAYNEKKTDMSYEEHVAFSREVVRAAEGKGFDEKVLDLKHWYRMRRR
jgi:hypothetical protein